MSRFSLAIAAAVILATTPIAPLGSAAAFPSGLPTVATESSPLLEVTHRFWHPRHCHRVDRRHYHRVIDRSAWHRHVGSSCRVRLVGRDHGDCIKIGDIRICF